jgi:hypothetical protein
VLSGNQRNPRSSEYTAVAVAVCSDSNAAWKNTQHKLGHMGRCGPEQAEGKQHRRLYEKFQR